MRTFYINKLTYCLAIVTCVLVAGSVLAEDSSAPAWLDGHLRWRASAPLVAAAEREGERCFSVKDPTVVRYQDRWHLFCTIRSQPRSHQIEYISFADWDHVDEAERAVLKITDGYFCAPQVFWFEPHHKWYLIYQASDPKRMPALQPAWSTNDKINAPDTWTAPTLLFDHQPANVSAWIDFWVICDANR